MGADTDGDGLVYDRNIEGQSSGLESSNNSDNGGTEND